MIRIKGRLGATALSAFPTMMSEVSGGDTVLTGRLEDRSAVFAAVAQIVGTGSGCAPVNRYSVCQASFESVWAVQNSSAILSGSKSVPGLTAPTIVTVAAWMPSSRTPAAISVCAERNT